VLSRTCRCGNHHRKVATHTQPDTVTTSAASVSAKPRRRAISVIATAGAFAVGLGIAGASPAAASPAPGAVENDYISALSANGYNADAATELKLGYLLCALNQVGASGPAGSQPYLNTAQDMGLCDYVSARGGPSEAAIRQDLQYQLQQANAPEISNWLNTDADHDGVSDADDGAQWDPGYH
jgi:hypothetical protein